MAKRARENESDPVAVDGAVDSDVDSVFELEAPTPEITRLQNEIKRVQAERGVLQTQLAALDTEQQHLFSEIETIETEQRNTHLAAKLLARQMDPANLPALAKHVAAIVADVHPRRGGYSVLEKDQWTYIVNRHQDVVFRIDRRGDVLTSTGKAKKFNVFDVVYNDLRLKIKQLVWR